MPDDSTPPGAAPLSTLQAPPPVPAAPTPTPTPEAPGRALPAAPHPAPQSTATATPTFRVLSAAGNLRAVWAADPVDLSTVQLDRLVVDAVHIDETRLSEEFAALPAHTARASEVYTRLRERALKAELHVKRVRAAQAGVIRAYLGSKAGGGRVTEGMVAEMLTLDPTVMEAEDVAVYADTLAAEARGVLSALNRKAEALVTIGANLRQERAFTGSMNAVPQAAPLGWGRPYPHVSTGPHAMADTDPLAGGSGHEGGADVDASGGGTVGHGAGADDALFDGYGPRGYRR